MTMDPLKQPKHTLELKLSNLCESCNNLWCKSNLNGTHTPHGSHDGSGTGDTVCGHLNSVHIYTQEKCLHTPVAFAHGYMSVYICSCCSYLTFYISYNATIAAYVSCSVLALQDLCYITPCVER